jgi:hypothetical protein
MNQVEKDFTFKVQFINFKVDSGHAEYYIKVIGPIGLFFHYVDRYSSMATFNQTVRRSITK